MQQAVGMALMMNSALSEIPPKEISKPKRWR
jgi:hypothetical protein